MAASAVGGSESTAVKASWPQMAALEDKASERMVPSAALPTTEPSDAIGDSVIFPRRQLVDFIVHYDGVDFHLHRLVLQHHSTYFRKLFDTPSQSADSETSEPTESFDSEAQTPAAKRMKQCNHPHIAHCIHLPQQTEATAVDFRLFLCHLYFSSHYSYAPYLPSTDIDLDSPSLCASVNLLPDISSPALNFLWPNCGLLRSTGRRRFLFNHSLVSLARQFECPQLLAHCETVMYLQFDVVHNWMQVDHCLEWLHYVDSQQLSNVKQLYIAIITEDEELLEREAYKEAKLTWFKELVLEIMEAMARRLWDTGTGSDDEESDC